MADKKNGDLTVSGAHLHYEVRGTGTVLLMLTGGHGDAHTMDALADHLADQYTVVTYDRRGLSRSTIEDRQADTSTSGKWFNPPKPSQLNHM